MVLVEILVFIVGAFVVAGVLASAVRTVVVPRGERVLIGRVVFVSIRVVFDAISRRRTSPAAVDRIMARYAPFALMVLPLAWAALIIGGFSAMFWALDIRPYRDALVLSGSSLTTLGFRSTDDLPTLVLSIFEALIGLGLFALLISFLPTMYTHFARREVVVSRFFMRATDVHGVASPVALLSRAHSVGALDELGDIWEEWEQWFVEIEESHTSFPSLSFFRSPVPDRSWITGAGLALDSAAIYHGVVDIPRSPRAPMMLRAGFLALRHIAEFFGIDHDPDPAPGDPISVERAEFDEVYDQLVAAGVPLIDREAGWVAFSGWRVNYDSVLLGLCALTVAPTAQWSSDRAGAYRRPRLRKRSER